MITTVERYKRRNWALRDIEGTLIAVMTYRKGARNLQKILAAETFHRNDEIATHENMEVEE